MLSHQIPPSQPSSTLPGGAFFGAPDRIARVWAQNRRANLEEELQRAGYRALDGHFDSRNFDQRAHELREVELIFATWGMPALSPTQLHKLPNLKAVFYAAGSVQSFARPFLERGILLCSAWAANGVPVAEWTLAQILLAGKGYWMNMRAASQPQTRKGAPHGRGNFGATVAILGAGQIGRRVIEFLQPFELKIIVFDPFLAAHDAEILGVETVSLDEAFARGQVVSNHLANLPATIGMLRGHHFAKLPTDATFINTGRGATICENEFIEILRARPDMTALLDVTNPEPPHADSPFYELPNIYLTSHIAGSIGDETVRMADYMIAEWQRWQRGQELHCQVTLPMLETMA